MLKKTVHWETRQQRTQFIKDVIGIGNVVRTFNVDKGHRDGPELHTVTDTGIIIIRNAITEKLVTMLIARPGQIYRYYANENTVPPTYLMDIAREHTEAGYNYR